MTVLDRPPGAGPATAATTAGRRRRRRVLLTGLVAAVLIVVTAIAVRMHTPAGAAPAPAVRPTSVVGSTGPATPGAVTAAPGPVAVQDPTTSVTVAGQPESEGALPATRTTHWRPEAGLTWQWQLSVPVDQTVDADVYDIDLFENDASVVASLHAAGRRVICYIDVGGWEDYRADAGDFPAEVLGKTIDGWPSERWLDIRRIDILRPLMAARFDLCAARGFDGVEPDLVDAASADTGFGLTPADQLAYNLMIAELAHERGLAVGLKNDLTQIPALVGTFDFAVNEQCAEYSECAMLVPFIAAGKPVFHAEYDLPTTAFCEETTRLGFSSVRKQLDLGAWRETCS